MCNSHINRQTKWIKSNAWKWEFILHSSCYHMLRSPFDFGQMGTEKYQIVGKEHAAYVPIGTFAWALLSSRSSGYRHWLRSDGRLFCAHRVVRFRCTIFTMCYGFVVWHLIGSRLWERVPGYSSIFNWCTEQNQFIVYSYLTRMSFTSLRRTTFEQIKTSTVCNFNVICAM